MFPIRQHRDHGLGPAGGVGSRGGCGGARGNKRLCGFWLDIENTQRKAGFEQVASHRPTHGAEPYETDAVQRHPPPLSLALRERIELRITRDALEIRVGGEIVGLRCFLQGSSAFQVFTQLGEPFVDIRHAAGPIEQLELRIERERGARIDLAREIFLRQAAATLSAFCSA